MQSASRLIARLEREVGDHADDLLEAAERGKLKRELETLHANWPVLLELVRLRADLSAAASPAGTPPPPLPPPPPDSSHTC